MHQMHDEKMPAVYLLASQRNGTLYVGVTSALWNRVATHKDKGIAGFSARHNVTKLVWYEHHPSMESAIRREKQIKKWYRAWKLDLIETFNPQWRDLHDDIDPDVRFAESLGSRVRGNDGQSMMQMSGRSFTNIDTWVFDLDNTLYPASCRLFDQMHVRMSGYVMEHFNLAYPEARAMQRDLFLRHGTTLRGLMVEHGHAPEGFLAAVHDIDYSSVHPNPTLSAGLARLPGRKIVFTNGTAPHAHRVLERLGVTEAFHGVFDIVDCDHIPKPAAEPYGKFLRAHNVDPARAAFFEDIPHNLEVPHGLGMVTVLVLPDTNDEIKEWHGDKNAPYVDHITEDLSDFLTQLQLGD
jgi:putative hydrolase of the HAD superfamily